MKKNLKTQLRDYIVVRHPFHQRKVGSRILCFHDIQDQKAFDQRIQWLTAHFEIVPIEKVLSHPEKNQLALTFDDGYQSWVTHVMPILDRYRLPATFFVNSGLVGMVGFKANTYFKEQCKRSPEGLKALTLEALFTLASHPGFEIGGHTRDHFLFSSGTSSTDLNIQIAQDKQQLETWIGRPIRYFAYPFGQAVHAPSHVRKAVETAGYLNAFSIIPGFVKISESPYFINRDSLELFQTDMVWDRWLHGAYDDLVWIKQKIYQALGIPHR